MKKTNKKGFTLVELVIVIAVIAILAAVLIPVFSNLINDAKEAAALADARTVYEQYIVEAAQAKEEVAGDLIIQADETHYFAVKEGAFDTNPNKDLDAAKEIFAAEGKTVNTTIKVVNTKNVYIVTLSDETSGG
jgi:type IV pilus assembly protein PilA